MRIRRIIAAFAALAVVFSCHDEQEPGGDTPGGQVPGGNTDPEETENLSPDLRVTCVTGDASEVEYSDSLSSFCAVLAGRAQVFNAGENAVHANLYYSTDAFDQPDSLAKYGKKAEPLSIPAYGGVFTFNLTGLSVETDYYYMASVTVGKKTAFHGEIKSFKTGPKPKPLAVTAEVDSVTVWSARMWAYANPNKNSGKVRPGIAYSKDSLTVAENPAVADVLIADDTRAEIKYSVMATNLSSDTRYFYRSFVRLNDGQYFYSDTLCSFSTLPVLAEIVVHEAASVDEFSAVLGGELSVLSQGELPVQRWFLYGKTGSDSVKKIYTDESFSAPARFLDCGTEYFVKAEAKVYDVVFQSDTTYFTTLDFNYAAVEVDLGLSVYWSDLNLGATSLEKDGLFFAWGESDPKDYFSWENYKLSLGTDNSLISYCPVNRSGYWGGEGSPDNVFLLKPEDDVASLKLQDGWRLPTREEFEALRSSCTWDWIVLEDVPGYMVIAANGSRIFLPASGLMRENGKGQHDTYGMYWASSLDVLTPSCAYALFFSSSSVNVYSRNRYFGFTIRPVKDKTPEPAP